MMGRKQKLKDGDEYDCASTRSRALLSFRPGQTKSIKRKMNKRWRKEAKKDILKEINH